MREHGCSDAGDGEMSDDELAGISSLLLVAGHETTSNMLGLGTLALLRHPEQLAMVRDDPSTVDAAVEELMRWLSIVHTGVARTTTTEVEIAGRTIPAGELVLCALPAARWGTSRSGTVCTTARAPRWPGWRCPSRGEKNRTEARLSGSMLERTHP